ncbi:uncharacterized protein zgc:158701 [Pseudorasbora parva]|uniref:uncharacterized protein zgc:158701 n=1 Tax=Pseudorasbora parva TaxID=51549 RepID=UPI00351E6272
MKVQVILLAFAVVVATNIHCQVQSQLTDADTSPVFKGHVMSRQVWKCNCNGRRISLEQNCPCELQRQNRMLSKEQRAVCQKKGIVTYKKCQQLTGGNRKEKNVRKVYSMPI